LVLATAKEGYHAVARRICSSAGGGPFLIAEFFRVSLIIAFPILTLLLIR
jgi:hypothetical protein